MRLLLALVCAPLLACTPLNCDLVKLKYVDDDGTQRAGGTWTRCEVNDRRTGCKTWSLSQLEYRFMKLEPIEIQLGQWYCPAGVRPPNYGFEDRLTFYEGERHGTDEPGGGVLVQHEAQ